MYCRKNMKNIAGWLDGHENQKDGCMYIKNVWIERNIWMDKTNRWIPKWKIGWI